MYREFPLYTDVVILSYSFSFKLIISYYVLVSLMEELYKYNMIFSVSLSFMCVCVWRFRFFDKWPIPTHWNDILFLRFPMIVVLLFPSSSSLSVCLVGFLQDRKRARAKWAKRREREISSARERERERAKWMYTLIHTLTHAHRDTHTENTDTQQLALSISSKVCSDVVVVVLVARVRLHTSTRADGAHTHTQHTIELQWS